MHLSLHHLSNGKFKFTEVNLIHTHTHMHMCTRKHAHTDTQTILQPSWILSGTTQVSRHKKGKTRKVKPIWIYGSKRQWVAVASAGPYANLHIDPDKKPHQHPITQFFYMLDAHPAAQPTASKHWRHFQFNSMRINLYTMANDTWNHFSL